MLKYLKTCGIIFGVTLSFSAYSQRTSPELYDLYILIGQSNMAGRGVITPEFKHEHNNNVFMLNKDDQWVPARHPLHYDKVGSAGVGPGLAFGIQMAKANRKVKIGLIPCAVGGTSIEKWVTGAYDEHTKFYPYDNTVRRIKVAMAFGTIRGIIWHQGEANSSPEKTKLYLSQLTILINNLRELIKNPELPFVAGELGRFLRAAPNFNNELRQLPFKAGFTAIASSKGLKHKGDSLHFDGRSAQKLGKRFALKMLNLQKL